MQEGYLFSDTIARNIAISDDEPDIERIRYAARVANIADYIEALPLSLIHISCVYGFGESSLCSGNLKHTSLSKIWHTDKWNMLRGGILLKDLHTCKACALDVYKRQPKD